MESFAGPIFIGGLDRSGKTPLGLMLSCHPNLSLTRRTYLWTRFYNRYGDISQVANFERCLAAMIRHEPIRKLEPDLERIRWEFWQDEPSYARLFALFHEQVARKAGKTRWVDQLAFVEYYADPIFAAYPDARMVHMIRHPLQRLGAALGYRRPKRGKVGADLARWVESVHIARRNQERYPGRYKIVQYESLTCNREETLREILSFLGEDFDPAMLAPVAGIQNRDGDLEKLDLGDPIEPEPDQPIPVSDADLWRGLTGEEITFMQAFAQDEMQAFGYWIYPVGLSFRNRLSYYLIDWPANIVGAAYWKMKKDQRIHTT